MFTCIGDFQKGIVPQHITFKGTSSELTEVTLPITDNRGMNEMYNLTICAHGPLRGNFSETRLLIEWFETYLILGADRFVVYNDSGSSSLKPLIEYYVKQGVLDIYDISVPSGVKLFNRGQMVIIQDCIYRYMYKTKYLALIDFDEYIIPTTSTTIVSMFDNREPKESCGNFQLPKYWFCTDFASTKNSTMKVSLLAAYTERNTVAAAGKTIIQPQRISQGRVHSVSNLRGYRDCKVQHADGYIHHYRKSDNIKTYSNFVKDTVDDSTAFRFFDQLLPNLMRLFQMFPKNV